ncbi:MAG: hypothetical protein AAB425_04630 [Bdellovibrionota bacterium]
MTKILMTLVVAAGFSLATVSAHADVSVSAYKLQLKKQVKELGKAMVASYGDAAVVLVADKLELMQEGKLYKKCTRAFPPVGKTKRQKACEDIAVELQVIGDEASELDAANWGAVSTAQGAFQTFVDGQESVVRRDFAQGILNGLLGEGETLDAEVNTFAETEQATLIKQCDVEKLRKVFKCTVNGLVDVYRNSYPVMFKDKSDRMAQGTVATLAKVEKYKE